jgi:hypothetical protein
MSKLIQFSAEEINELRSYYSNELAASEERIKHIRAILSKIGDSSIKRGRKPLKEVTEDLNAIAIPAKKRGRPSKKNSANKIELSSNKPKKLGRPAKIKTAEIKPVEIVQKKRGRKPKNTPVVDQGLTKEIIPVAQIVTAKPEGKKRGRKPAAEKAPKIISPAKVLNRIKVSKTSTKAKKASNVTATKAADPLKKPKATPSKATPSKATPSKATPSKGKTLNANPLPASAKPARKQAKPAKVSVEKGTAKKVKSTAKAANKVVVKADVPPKKVSKKVLYQDFIFKTIKAEPRFFTTEEIVNAGIKAFDLKGNEKDAAKNTMQFILNGLQSQDKILRRRKEKDRQAYWAALDTSDAGYLK